MLPGKQKKKKIVEADSIVDEVASAALTGSNKVMDSNSIIDDNIEAADDDSMAESSIQEDSFIQDKFDNVKQEEKKLEARNRTRFGIGATVQQ